MQTFRNCIVHSRVVWLPSMTLRNTNKGRIVSSILKALILVSSLYTGLYFRFEYTGNSLYYGQEVSGRGVSIAFDLPTTASEWFSFHNTSVSKQLRGFNRTTEVLKERLVPIDEPATQTESTSRFPRLSTFFPEYRRQTDLPAWIQNYVTWHQEMRAKYPGSTLITDPEAPNILLRTCFHRCGGLHDRLGYLPWDLFLANQTQRVLLLQWCYPSRLEDYLMPNQFNWSVPSLAEMPEFQNKSCSDIAKSTLELFHGFSSERPQGTFWSHDFDYALVRAKTDPKFKNAKILRHRILGNDAELAKRTVNGNRKAEDLNHGPAFGNIFWTFFRLAEGLAQELDRTLQEELSGLSSPGTYSAVHVRARHPKSGTKHARGKVYKAGGADKWGLLFEGPGKDAAIQTASHAMDCILQASNATALNEPIYFYADSDDLAQYMSTIWRKNDTDAKWHTNETNHGFARILTRRSHHENLHIDRQEHDDPAVFYPSFIDLLLGAQARCISYGVGNFGYFSAKLSNTPCRVLYQHESWGVDDLKGQNSLLCKL